MGGGFDHCVWLCPHFVWIMSSERLSLLQSNLAWQCVSQVVMHRMGLLSLMWNLVPVCIHSRCD